MDNPSKSIRDLSLRLLSVEASARSKTDPHEAIAVCEKLRESLTRLAGAEGFSSLMRRALSLARSEFPVLETVQILPDGRLDGFGDLVEKKGDRAAAALVSNFLSLLVTFIGEPMTIRLVHENWPQLKPDRKP